MLTKNVKLLVMVSRSLNLPGARTMVSLLVIQCLWVAETRAENAFGMLSGGSKCEVICDSLEGESVVPDQFSGTLLKWNSGRRAFGGPDLNAPLVTDRPDFTEASSTVGRGVTQLEFGYTYTKNHDEMMDEKTHSYPEVLLRQGLLEDWLELRLAWNYSNLELGVTEDAGAEDLYLGFKIALTPQDQFLPEMALIPQMTVPTGENAFSSDKVLPGLNWIYGWELNDSLSTAGSTQFNRAVDESEVHTEWAQSWTIATSLTKKIGGYAEWFGIFPDGAVTAKTEHYFNGGFTYLLNHDVQWDVRGGVGLNDDSDDYFIGTGLSVRFH